MREMGGKWYDDQVINWSRNLHILCVIYWGKVSQFYFKWFLNTVFADRVHRVSWLYVISLECGDILDWQRLDVISYRLFRQLNWFVLFLIGHNFIPQVLPIDSMNRSSFYQLVMCISLFARVLSVYIGIYGVCVCGCVCMYENLKSPSIGKFEYRYATKVCSLDWWCLWFFTFFFHFALNFFRAYQNWWTDEDIFIYSYTYIHEMMILLINWLADIADDWWVGSIRPLN